VLAVFGLHFNHTWDLTAAGTLALAAVTLAAVVVAAVSLRRTGKAIELSREEVEEAHRPVVVPVIDKTFMDLGSDGALEKRPALMRDNATLVVPVENIGTGPALRVKATVTEWNGPGGSFSAYGMGGQKPAETTGLGVGVLMPLLLTLPWEVAGGPLASFRVSITYEDLARKAWATTALYVAARGRYAELDIAAITVATPGFRQDPALAQPVKATGWTELKALVRPRR